MTPFAIACTVGELRNKLEEVKYELIAYEERRTLTEVIRNAFGR